MRIHILRRVKLALHAHLFQALAHDRLDAGKGRLIIRVDQLQSQATGILVVGAFAHHVVAEHLFATPQAELGMGSAEPYLVD